MQDTTVNMGSPTCISSPVRQREESHSRHEEDASHVGHAASAGWGGMLVIATYATQQAQVKKYHNEGQQEADNQATQPPGEGSMVLLYIEQVLTSQPKSHRQRLGQLRNIPGNLTSEFWVNSLEGETVIDKIPSQL